MKPPFIPSRLAVAIFPVLLTTVFLCVTWGYYYPHIVANALVPWTRDPDDVQDKTELCGMLTAIYFIVVIVISMPYIGCQINPAMLRFLHVPHLHYWLANEERQVYVLQTTLRHGVEVGFTSMVLYIAVAWVFMQMTRDNTNLLTGVWIILALWLTSVFLSLGCFFYRLRTPSTHKETESQPIPTLCESMSSVTKPQPAAIA
ncbi:hypothetical protein BZG36_02151 [Bifiguratus adelaidae]|uniref:Uncharacterized protein n=1 Tax=Bifiguratus adelaidae TaxID=1938954 RepID=A0A261Y333_9FUNG|nr:hypothetical protein BZG36_02151 [Bifiguratus adelaidae]